MSEFVIFTDLDGTLLDHYTYSWDPAEQALQRIRETKTPLVMVSSKTRLEIEALRRALDNTDPFISENGGAVFIPADSNLVLPRDTKKRDDYQIIVLGLTVEELGQKLDRLASRFPIKVLSRMDAAEVTDLTGLTLDQARLAQTREYGEAFILTDKSISEKTLAAAVSGQGLKLTRGGRFYHLLGGNDKAGAVEILIGLYRQKNPDLVTIGLGESWNDIPLLTVVDKPFLVARPDETHISVNLPGLNRVALAGPAGFNQAVMDLLA